MTSVLIQGDRGLAVRRFRCAADGRRAQAPIESDGIGATLVRRVCMYCNKEMGTVVGSPDRAGRITHSACAPCVQRVLAELPGVPHPTPSPASPGADVVAAGRAQGTLPGQVTGTTAPVSQAAVLEHLSGGPAAASAPPRGLFWTVTGTDFGRVIRWAKNHWRNPLDALVRDRINQIKEGKQ